MGGGADRLRPWLGLLASALSVAALLAGCASAQAPRDEIVEENAHEDGVIASSGPDSVVEARRISEEVATRIVLVPWSRPGQDLSASAAQQRLTILRQRKDDPTADGHGVARTTWYVRRYRTADGRGVPLSVLDDPTGLPSPSPPPDREQKLVLTEGGSVALAREVNAGEAVVIEFEPPMYVLPARLPNNGQQCIFENIHMMVHPIAHPESERASGKVRHSICYEADEILRTPAGEFETHRLVSRFKADLGTSKVENVTTQWFAQGVGLIAERRWEQTWALGVRIRNNSEAWIAAEIEPRPGSAQAGSAEAPPSINPSATAP